MSALRVVVADDSVLLREGLVRVLDEAGFERLLALGPSGVEGSPGGPA